jgi:hypothetical protein
MRCKKASLGPEEILIRRQVLASIGRSLREGSDTSQPLPDRLANLVRQIAELTEDKNQPRDGSPFVAGMRSFFHVSDVRARQYRDEFGKVFATPDEAIAHASVLAGQLLQGKDWEGGKISITDHDEKDVAKINVGAWRGEAS